MNYPDDIRSYDDDPRSPFYKPPPCQHCGSVDECECCDECLFPDGECICKSDASAEAATQRLNEKQEIMQRAARPMQTHSFDGGE